MAKLYMIGKDFYAFHCPGCECGHAITVSGRVNTQGATWSWNGSLTAPTFLPSIDCNKDEPEIRCHSFVTDGMIRFLADSFHVLKGKEVEIPEWEE